MERVSEITEMLGCCCYFCVYLGVVTISRFLSMVSVQKKLTKIAANKFCAANHTESLKTSTAPHNFFFLEDTIKFIQYII
jgi:hypothetical protein